MAGKKGLGKGLDSMIPNKNAGSSSKAKAETEFEKYRVVQD